jgi:hypothetical protein
MTEQHLRAVLAGLMGEPGDFPQRAPVDDAGATVDLSVKRVEFDLDVLDVWLLERTELPSGCGVHRFLVSSKAG